MEAIVKQTETVPIHRYAEIDGVHWIEIEVEDWNDVKRLNRKTLQYEGREYTWSCWNSDRMVSIFRTGWQPKYATIKA